MLRLKWLLPVEERRQNETKKEKNSTNRFLENDDLETRMYFPLQIRLNKI